jgi:hypothetical protein
MPERTRSLYRAVAGLVTGASGTVAVLGIGLAVVCYVIGSDVTAAVNGPIGDLGDLYAWLFGLLVFVVVAAVGLVSASVGVVAACVAGTSGYLAFRRRRAQRDGEPGADPPA